MRKTAFVLFVVMALAVSACTVTIEGPSGSVKGSGRVVSEARAKSSSPRVRLRR
jgi:predicted small secreted protein